MPCTDFSSPCPENGYYDVFLSFRGADTRNGFTHNLYRLLQENKVHTFMDVDLIGEDIDYLFEIVEKSRIAVVIYSENFASSNWCLRELDLILQRRKEKKMLIIPIFYKVDVHELKHLTGNTMKCLDNQISKYDKTTVQKWKDAITYLSNISGLSYKSSYDRPEYDFTMDVIVKIKKKIRESKETRDRLYREKCIKLSSRSLNYEWGDNPKHWIWMPSSEPKSSFEDVAFLKDVCWLDIGGVMGTHLLSPGIHYGVYFVFKLTDNAYGFKHKPVEVKVSTNSAATGQLVVVKSVYLDKEGRRRDEIVPNQRMDGWSEIEMGELYVVEGEEAKGVGMSVFEVNPGHGKGGMMVEGFEIRPKD